MTIFGYTLVKDWDYIHLVSDVQQKKELEMSMGVLQSELIHSNLMKGLAEDATRRVKTELSEYKNSVNTSKIAFKERLMAILVPTKIFSSADDLIKYVDALAEGVYNG